MFADADAFDAHPTKRKGTVTMPRTRKPRAGSLQFWPRVRAKRTKARIRSWVSVPKKMGGFPAYKAGMTHIHFLDTNPNNLTKGSQVFCPVTILECPPVRVIAVRTYKKTYDGLKVAGEVLASNLDKFVGRALSLPKKQMSIDQLSQDGVVAVRVLVATTPHIIALKKTPEILEFALGGKDAAEQFALAKELFGKEVSVDSVFAAGEQVDIHAITKGKGTTGPVKRFGIHFKFRKSEKGRRAPGSTGPWHGPKNWRTAYSGQTGFQQRMELNKLIMKVGDKPEEINQKGGITHYGLIKSKYLLVKGSVGGAKQRLVTLTPAQRPERTVPKKAPTITYVSQESKQ